MDILLDSWAIIELFRGTKEGARVHELLKQNPLAYTTVLNLYEVHYRIQMGEGEREAQQVTDFVESRLNVLNIDRALALAASELHAKEKLGTVDAFSLAAARCKNATLVTGDPDFKHTPGVTYLGK